MQESPVIFLIQGSFQVPGVYERLVHSLQTLGHVTIQPRLPSCTDTDAPEYPQTTLVDDALAVRMELVRQVEYEHKTVVVAMHSYGGLVGSEAIPEDLSYTKRQSLGLPGGIIHLFYFCAFILDQGQSVLGTFGESPNNDVHVRNPVPAPRGYVVLTGQLARRTYVSLGGAGKALWRSARIRSVDVGIPAHCLSAQGTDD